MKKKIVSYGLSAIVLLSVLAMVTSATAVVVQMADEFGVNNAMGNSGTYVVVPVNIMNVTNGPIQTITFDVLYDHSILELDYDNDYSLLTGDLTAGTKWNFMLGSDEKSVTVGTSKITQAIPNGSTGSVVLLNFSVIGAGESIMNMSEIDFANTTNKHGTAPAKNGTFRVDAGPPSVTNPDANPGTIEADGFQESILNVTVVDDIAVDVVVTVDLTQIGGPAEKIMAKIDGTHYSTTTNATIGTTPDTYYLPINATDLLGNYNNTEDFTLIVEAPANGSIVGQITYACNGSWIPEVIVNLTKEGSVEATTVTNETGYYNFTDVDPDSYFVNASKTGFWDNSTDVTVSAGVTTTVDTITLWLKGDLDGNGEVADAVDVNMMIQASVDDYTGDWKFDLDDNGDVADAVDVNMMIQASVDDYQFT